MEQKSLAWESGFREHALNQFILCATPSHNEQMFVGFNWPELTWRVKWSGSNNAKRLMGNPLPSLIWDGRCPDWPCPWAPALEMAPVLSLRPDKQEMTVVSCKELSSSLRDDFVWMWACCTVGREAAEILMGASLGSGSMEKEGRSPPPWG